MPFLFLQVESHLFLLQQVTQYVQQNTVVVTSQHDPLPQLPLHFPLEAVLLQDIKHKDMELILGLVV